MRRPISCAPSCLTEGALIVVDMQADFVPADPANNPHGGHFGVAEGDHIAGTVVQLINAAILRGGGRGDSRLHPIDHVSFISQGGPFPATACKDQRLTLSPSDQPSTRCRHPAAWQWSKRSDGRLQGVPRGHRLPWWVLLPRWRRRANHQAITGGDASTSSKAAPCGCSAAPWTGCMVLKQSAISPDWLAAGGEIDMNAPPDICALVDDDEENAAAATKRRAPASLETVLKEEAALRLRARARLLRARHVPQR